MKAPPKLNQSQSTYKRDTHTQSIHSSKRWTNLSLYVRSIFPLCCSGLHENIIPPATQVHHILPITTHPELAYTITNLIPLCDFHHKQLEGNKNLVSPFINYKETSSTT